MKKQLKRMLTAQIRASDTSADSESASEIYNLSFATEQPVTRYDFEIGEYNEILLCSPENVDLTRLNSGTGTLLFNHNWDQHVGGIKSCTVDADKVCRADVQFSEFGIGPEVKGKVLEGTLQGVSFGYEILEYKLEGSNLFATKWAPYEISIVTVPADITVGLGRALPVNDDEEEEQAEEVDSAQEENLENESEQSEQDVSTEADQEFANESESGTEDPGNGGESTDTETAAEENPATADNVEVETESEPVTDESVNDSETETVNEENSENLINTNNETGDNTDNKEPAPQTANDEEDKNEIRAMASAFNLNQSATQELIKQLQNGESLENIRNMIRSGNITTKNNNNNKGNTMTTASLILRDLIAGTNASNFETKNGRAYVPFGSVRSGVNFAGGAAALDATEHRQDLFVDSVIGFSALSKLNAQIFSGLSANLDIPVEVPGGDVGWMADDSAVPADHAVAFSKINLTKRYLGSKALMSRAFIEYAAPNGGDKVGEILMKRAAKTLEKAVFTSVAAQVAVANTADATVADVDAKVVDAIGTVGGYHADVRAVMHPSTKAALRQIKVGGNTAGRFMIDDTNNQLRGLEVIESVYVPTNVILIGAWDQLLIGNWGAGVEVEVLRDPSSGGYAVFVWAETDYKLANVDTAFAKINLLSN